MAIKIEQVPGLSVPESLFDVIVNAITKQGESIGNASELTLNFRDKDYSAAAGGFHPVEVRLEKRGISWELVYITPSLLRLGVIDENQFHEESEVEEMSVNCEKSWTESVDKRLWREAAKRHKGTVGVGV